MIMTQCNSSKEFEGLKVKVKESMVGLWSLENSVAFWN